MVPIHWRRPCCFKIAISGKSVIISLLTSFFASVVYLTFLSLWSLFCFNIHSILENIFSRFPLFLVVKSCDCASTNEIHCDERETPIGQINEPLGSVFSVINSTRNRCAKAEHGDDKTIQQNGQRSKPLGIYKILA